MPQMAPLMWSNLLFWLMITMIILMNMIYFSHSSKQMKLNQTQNMSVKSKNKNWLW